MTATSIATRKAICAAGQARAPSTVVTSASAELVTEEDVAGHECGDAGGENGRACPRELVERARERCTLGRRDRDDAKQDRQVRISVRIQRRARASNRAQRCHRAVRRLRIADEIEPPQAGAQAEAEQDRDDERAVHGKV